MGEDEEGLEAENKADSVTSGAPRQPAFLLSMHSLTALDARHLQAAQGWLELGNYLEANEELDQIMASERSHPDVLELRWAIYAKAGKWDACLDIATALVQMVPKRPLGWNYRSTSLHHLGRTREAHDLLLPAAAMFPKDWAICYDLSRYACRLGKLDEARDWLAKAFALGDAKQLKLMALDDPDLEMIWTGF